MQERLLKFQIFDQHVDALKGQLVDNAASKFFVPHYFGVDFVALLTHGRVSPSARTSIQ
jgi:hypothetical protein